MNVRERFLKTMRFEQPDRLPMLEWAVWWDKTIDRWKTEGLSVDHQTPPGVSLDNYRIFLRLFREYTERAAAECRT